MSAVSPRRETIEQYDFARRKYGRHLLVDVARIEALPGFVLDDRPHRLSFFELAFIESGAGHFLLDDRPLALEPHRVLFTAPGQVRRWRATEPVRGFLLFFEAELLAEFLVDARFVETLPFFGADRTVQALSVTPLEFAHLRAVARSARREIVRFGPGSGEVLRDAVVEALLALRRIHRRAAGAGAVDAGGDAVADRVRRFRRLVEEQFRRHHRVRDYAAQLAVTPAHLNALVRARLGKTAGAVVRDRILVEAMRLLRHTDRSVASVGRELGFEDSSYFARFVRRATGAAPTDLRRPG